MICLSTHQVQERKYTIVVKGVILCEKEQELQWLGQVENSDGWNWISSYFLLFSTTFPQQGDRSEERLLRFHFLWEKKYIEGKMYRLQNTILKPYKGSVFSK